MDCERTSITVRILHGTILSYMNGRAPPTRQECHGIAPFSALARFGALCDDLAALWIVISRCETGLRTNSRRLTMMMTRQASTASSLTSFIHWKICWKLENSVQTWKMCSFRLNLNMSLFFINNPSELKISPNLIMIMGISTKIKINLVTILYLKYFRQKKWLQYLKLSGLTLLTL